MKLKYVSWIPAFILMVIIYFFSSKPVVESNDSSISIAERILSVYEDITDRPIDADIRVERLEMVNHLVRKGAHFTEYALLAISIAFHFYVCKKRGLPLILISVLISAFYASTDEFHQLFVEGRGGQVRDVILDTTGAIAGTLFFVLITGAYKHNRRKVT